jgi:hypothetical protein
MVAGKTSTLTVPIESGLKEALRTAEVRARRSFANSLGVLVRDY